MHSLFINLRLHFIMLAIFGGLYPLLFLALGQLDTHLAEGQPITENGKVIGFANIGQANTLPGDFHPRPSAVSYNAASTGGSNKGSTNPDYLAEVKLCAELLRKEHSATANSPVPADLVTASGSGIDPDITVEAANYQAARVAKARNLPMAKILTLIENQTNKPIFGPATVNVLALNLALHKLP